MRADTKLHGVTAIELADIKGYTRTGSCEPFYHRSLIITMADGTTETISLFADNGYNLLVSDDELTRMNEPQLKAA